MTIIRTHDALFRFVFGEPEQLAELLRAHLPTALADAIDWKTLRRADSSFVDAALQGRHADMLFEADMGDVRVLLYLLNETSPATNASRRGRWRVTSGASSTGGCARTTARSACRRCCRC